MLLSVLTGLMVAGAAWGVMSLSGDVSDMEDPMAAAGAPVFALSQRRADERTDVLLLRHESGPTLPRGTYEISVTLDSEAPRFVECLGPLKRGASLTIQTLTPTAACDGKVLAGDGPALEPGNAYRVVIQSVGAEVSWLDVSILLG